MFDSDEEEIFDYNNFGYDDVYNRKIHGGSEQVCGINYEYDDEFDKKIQGSTEDTDTKDLFKTPTNNENIQENKNGNLTPFEVNMESDNQIALNTAFNEIFKKEQSQETESIVLIPEEVNTEKTVDNKSNKESIISNENKTEEHIGKKRKENYSTEKITKKVRMVVLKAIIHFINEKIKLFYNNNIGKGLKEMKFKEIDKTTLSHSKVDYDKEFLNFSLKQILSWDISGKMTNYLKEHNKNLVEKLINSETCSKYFRELFDLTFGQCLEHIQKQNYTALNGLMGCRKMFEVFCDEKEINDEEYYSIFKTILMEYQDFIRRKSSRKPRKKNN